MGKIKYGLKNVYYAVATEGADSSGNPTYTYGTPVRIPGAVNLSLQAAGETVEEYADDMKYFAEATNAGYTGTLECEVLPDSFLTDIMGMTKNSTGGKLVEAADDVMKEFALLGEFTIRGGTETGKRVVFYRCTASRPDVTSNTKGTSIEPQHDVLNIVAMPRPTDMAVKATAVSTDSDYANWFTAVQ